MGWFRRNNEANEELEKIQLALVALRVELDRERAEGATTRERLLAAAPDAVVDAGHFFPEERPEATAGTLERFLAPVR